MLGVQNVSSVFFCTPHLSENSSQVKDGLRPARAFFSQKSVIKWRTKAENYHYESLTFNFYRINRRYKGFFLPIIFHYMSSPRNIWNRSFYMLKIWRGHSEWLINLTMVGTWVVWIIGVYLLGITLGMGIAGIWIAIGLDNLFRGISLTQNFQNKKLLTWGQPHCYKKQQEIIPLLIYY